MHEATSLLTTIALVDPLEFFASYTFRTMLLGTTLVGFTAGMLGAFLYLTKQSMVSDVIGHSAISGVAVAFIVVSTLAGDGRSMLVLTLGSIVASTLAVLVANALAQRTRLGMDSAMAICLALFYGSGMVLLRVITHSSLPNRGGIDKYMFGNAATLTSQDLVTTLCFALFSVAIMAALWKEFKLFTFDPTACAAMGFSPRLLRPLLLGTATVAVVIGIKAVGLVLMVAFAITPAAAARQWTKHLSTMVMLSGAIGGVAGAVGSYLAVSIGRVPTGPVIVIVLTLVFVVSLLCAPGRSLIQRRRALAFQRRALLSSLQES